VPRQWAPLLLLASEAGPPPRSTSAVARAALVSEPTAYRYITDLASLLEEALAGIDPDPAAALAAGADPGDPVERSPTPPSFWRTS
jgi:AcrR family transcriptional regulator